MGKYDSLLEESAAPTDKYADLFADTAPAETGKYGGLFAEAPAAPPAETPAARTMGNLEYGAKRTYSAFLEEPAGAAVKLPFELLAYGAGKAGFTKTAAKVRSLGQFLGQTPVTEQVQGERQAVKQQAYDANYWVGIANDVSEHITDLAAFIAPMSAVTKGAKIAQIAEKSPSFVKNTATHLEKIGAYTAARTEGDVEERAQSAVHNMAFGLTAPIANATGAMGITASAVNAGINFFLNSDTYYRQIAGAKDKKEALSAVIPQMVLDIGFAWNTRGLPKNQIKAMEMKYYKERQKDVPPREFLSLQEELRKNIENPPDKINDIRKAPIKPEMIDEVKPAEPGKPAEAVKPAEAPIEPVKPGEPAKPAEAPKFREEVIGKTEKGEEIFVRKAEEPAKAAEKPEEPAKKLTTEQEAITHDTAEAFVEAKTKDIADKPRVKPAIQTKDGKVYSGTDHGDILARLYEEGIIPEADLKLSGAKSGWRVEGTKDFINEKYLLVKEGEKQLSVKDGYKAQLTEVWNKANKGKAAEPKTTELSPERFYEEAMKEAEKAGTGKLSKAIKTIIREETGQVKDKITVTEKGALKTKLKAEAKGAQEGIKEVSVQLKDVVKSAAEQLPPASRGKMLTLMPKISEAVRKGNTEMIKAEAQKRIEVEQEKVVSTQLTEQIKKEMARKNTTITVDSQRELNSMFATLDTAKMTQSTLDKLLYIDDYISKNKGKIRVSDSTHQILSRLRKRPISMLTNTEKAELVKAVKTIREEGRTALAMRNEFDLAERQKAEKSLLESTVNVDIKPTGNHGADRLRTEMRSKYFDITHAPRVFNIIDGMKNYKGENVGWVKELNLKENNAKTLHKNYVVDAAERIARVKNELTAKEVHDITYLLIKEQDGAHGHAQAYADAYEMKSEPVKTETYQKIMDIARESAQTNYDNVKGIYEATTNNPMGFRENYFPLQESKEFNVLPADAIQQTRHLSNTPAHGFTKGRKENAKYIPEENFMVTLDKHIGNREWYINMTPTLKNFSKLVGERLPDGTVQGGDNYKAKAGALGHSYAVNYVDRVARRGMSYGASSDLILRGTRLNLSKAVLGYKLTTILKQPFAIAEAIATSNSMYGLKVSAEVAKEFGKAWVNIPKTEREIKASEALSNRQGGEMAMEEIYESSKASSKLWGKYQRGAMWALQKADVITAAGVQKGVENALLRNGIEPAKAKADAEFFMNLASSSADVTMRPAALSKGEVGRALFTFQSFALNSFGIISEDVISGKIVNGKGINDRLNGITSLLILAGSDAVMNMAANKVNDTIKGKDTEDDSFWTNMVEFIPSQIPVFGGMMLYALGSKSRQGKYGDLGAPLVGALENISRGARAVATGKTPAKKLKGAAKAAGTVAGLGFGVGGAGQAVNILEGILSRSQDKDDDYFK